MTGGACGGADLRRHRGLSLLSKYVIRDRGRHVFNPSNLGLVGCFVLLGSGRVSPLDFWWGPMSGAMAAALVLIVIGGLSSCLASGCS